MLFDPWIRRGGQGKSKKKSVLFLSQRLERATILPLGPIHLEDEMSFRDELFRPGGKNLAWKFVLKKEAKKFVLFFRTKFPRQNFRPLQAEYFVLKQFRPQILSCGKQDEISAWNPGLFFRRNNSCRKAISSFRCIEFSFRWFFSQKIVRNFLAYCIFTFHAFQNFFSIDKVTPNIGC